MPGVPISKILEKYSPKREQLIPILQEIQATYGYLDEENIQYVSKYLKLPLSKIYGISTFYNEFSFIAHGQNHIKICHGSNCHVKGSGQLIKEVEKLLKIQAGETTRDGQFSLEVTSCLGGCGHGPVSEINSVFQSRTNLATIRQLVDTVKKQG